MDDLFPTPSIRLRSIENIPYPPGLKDALHSERINGFGFQVSASSLIIASYGQDGVDRFPTEEEQEQLNYRLQCNLLDVRTAEVDRWIGRRYIAINWSEYNQIPKVLQWFLDHGYWIRTANHLETTFDPRIVDERVFSWEHMERLSIAKFKSTAAKVHPAFNKINPWRWWAEKIPDTVSVLNKSWNWHTSEGKGFAMQLREACGKTRSMSKFVDRFWWPAERFETPCKEHKVAHHSDWSSYKLWNIENDGKPFKALSTISDVVNVAVSMDINTATNKQESTTNNKRKLSETGVEVDEDETTTDVSSKCAKIV